jgi:hypothetical protein
VLAAARFLPISANVFAARQIRPVLPRLGALTARTLFAFDGGYDPAQLTVELAGTAALREL